MLSRENVLLVAIPFLILAFVTALIGAAPMFIWHYTVFPLLIWFEEWFVRKGYYVDLKGKKND